MLMEFVLLVPIQIAKNVPKILKETAYTVPLHSLSITENALPAAVKVNILKMEFA